MIGKQRHSKVGKNDTMLSEIKDIVTDYYMEKYNNQISKTFKYDIGNLVKDICNTISLFEWWKFSM